MPPELLDIQSPDEIQIENQLLEQYLEQKGVKLPSDWSTEPIPNQKDEYSTPIDIKLQIAIEILSQLNSTLETRKEAANKLIITLKAMIKDTDHRVGDTQRDANDFKREVCTNHPERYSAEKFVRHMEGKL